MINNLVVNWFSRKQGLIENSVEVWKQVYCAEERDRMQIANMLKAKSVMKKKSNAIAEHAVREAVAMKEKLISYVNTDLNVSNIMTNKVLPARAQRLALIERLMRDITHDDSGCVNPGREDLGTDEQEKRLLG